MVRTRGDEIEESPTARVDRMERLIQEMAEALRQQQEWQQQWQQPHPPPPPPAPPMPDNQNDDRIIVFIKEFKKMKPPQFSWWIRSVEGQSLGSLNQKII